MTIRTGDIPPSLGRDFQPNTNRYLAKATEQNITPDAVYRTPLELHMLGQNTPLIFSRTIRFVNRTERVTIILSVDGAMPGDRFIYWVIFGRDLPDNYTPTQNELVSWKAFRIATPIVQTPAPPYDQFPVDNVVTYAWEIDTDKVFIFREAGAAFDTGALVQITNCKLTVGNNGVH